MLYKLNNHTCLLLHYSCVILQDVIPQALLDHYVSMTEPSKAQTIDTEIARHCAFSFPAVALTLGRLNWPCLRDTYEYLSSDMQVSSASLILFFTTSI